MPEYPVRPFEEFETHINEETEKARQELPTWINDLTVTTVGCVDSLTKKGLVNPPGGLIFLYQEVFDSSNALETFIKTRAEAGVTEGSLMAHENCGYMRVVLGLDELRSHTNMIHQAQQYLDQLNKRYHTNFQTMVENQGSAEPYMRK